MDFARRADKTLLGFEIKPAAQHHPSALCGMLRTAGTYGWLLTVGYGATFMYGVFAAGCTNAVNSPQS